MFASYSVVRLRCGYSAMGTCSAMGTLTNLYHENKKFDFTIKMFLPSVNGSKTAFSSKSFRAIPDKVFLKNPIQGFCDQTNIAPI